MFGIRPSVLLLAVGATVLLLALLEPAHARCACHEDHGDDVGCLDDHGHCCHHGHGHCHHHHHRRGDRGHVIRPRPCNRNLRCSHRCAYICATGCNTPLTTFRNLCFARRYAARHNEILYVVHSGRCRCAGKPC